MWDLVVCKERLSKQGMVMKAVAKGMAGEGRIRWDEVTKLPDRFMVAGQLWAVRRLTPQAIVSGTPFWMIDNGYYMQSGKGKHETGHWEFTYRGLEPVLLDRPDFSRFPAKDHLQPWKKDRGDYILIGHPGPGFGLSMGYNMKQWSSEIVEKVRKVTDRPIRERTKWSTSPIEKDLAGAHVLITHSSHCVIDAIRLGIPAIVAPSSPAAPVCSTSLADIESPPMPDRERWWASLMSQQFTLKEIESGLAWKYQRQIMEQVDGK
jgi:hypothetical protein